MGKKLTETSKWKSQRWFRLLPPYYKLAWEYINGVCDIDGTWTINCPDLIDDTRIPPPFNLQEFIDSCNTDYDAISGEICKTQRLIKVNNEFIWIVGYIKEQLEDMRFRTVNPLGGFAKAAFYKLGGKGLLYEAITRGYIPLPNPPSTLTIPSKDPQLRVQYKDIEVDKERDKEVLKNFYIDDGGQLNRVKGKGQSQRLTVVPGGEVTGAYADVENHPPMGPEEFKEFQNLLVNDHLFIDPIMATRGIPDETTLRKYLNIFQAHLIAEEKIAKRYADYRKHFKNWIPRAVTDVTSSTGAVSSKKNNSVQIPSVTPDQLDKYKKQG